MLCRLFQCQLVIDLITQATSRIPNPSSNAAAASRHEVHDDIHITFQHNVKDWLEIKPSTSFQWHDCFDEFKCARLRVPMDWRNVTNERDKHVDIAVIKVEATVPVTHPQYGGAIVLNPGGPGGSGVQQILDGGYDIRTIVSARTSDNSTTARRFDIIGFDPRGINNTTPFITCWPDHLAAAQWALEHKNSQLFDSSDVAFDDLWARYRALALGCGERVRDEGIGKHVSTPAVARDMLEIVERHAQWRAEEAERLLLDSACDMTRSERSDIQARTAYEAGREQLQYWGFSYGSLLGGTFAALFPERVKRLVLDGVVDFLDYQAAGWTTNLPDTDTQFIVMAERCMDEGPEKCPIYDPNGYQAILTNVQYTMLDLKSNPIMMPGDKTTSPDIIRYDDLRLFIRYAVYNPLRDYPTLVQILAEAAERNGTTLKAVKDKKIPSLGIPLPETCKKPYSYPCVREHLRNSYDLGAQIAISCSDGASRLNQTKDEYRQYAEDLVFSSSLLGAFWSTIMMPCTAWTARASWRYEGDYTVKTAHPVLFVGNTLDPVTPLRNAIAMAKRYDGSGVIHQDSLGHCSTSGISMQTMKALRHYFGTGELPGVSGGVEGYDGAGLFSSPDRVILDGYTKDEDIPLPKGEEDEDLWKAVVGIARDW